MGNYIKQVIKLKECKQVENIFDESGFTLVEILGAIVILGIALVMIAMMIIQNNLILSYNTRMEEAIAVRDDVKEWLTYRAQTQDVANLNLWLFTTRSPGMILNPDEQLENRRQHLIVDNSGIQYDSHGQSFYGEIPIPIDDANRGRFIRKVAYDLTGDHLPHSLVHSEVNRLYMGTYLSENDQPTNYLVKISIRDDRVYDNTQVEDLDRRQQGMGLVIQVFDKQTGEFLTETFMHWVVDY